MILEWKKEEILRDETDVIALSFKEKTLFYNGFVYFGFKTPLKSDGTYHYYSLNELKNHIHLYYRLRTGSSRVKEFDFTEAAQEYCVRFGSGSMHEILLFVKILRPHLKRVNLLNLQRFQKDKYVLKKESDDAFKLIHNLNSEKIIFLERLLQQKFLFSDLRFDTKTNVLNYLHAARVYSTAKKQFGVVKNVHLAILYELFLQLMRKMLGIEKVPLTSGAVIGITGPDGAGKSTIIRELENMGRRRGFIFLHFGLPNLLPLDRLKNKYLFRRFSGKKKGKITQKRVYSLKSKIYRLDLAFRRMMISNAAKIFAKLGFIVIFDRYYNQCTKVDIDGRSLSSSGRIWSKLENRMYQYIPSCDLQISVQPNLESVLKRNSEREKQNKEDAPEIIGRYEQYQNMETKTLRSVVLDSSEQSVQQSAEFVLKQIWNC